MTPTSKPESPDPPSPAPPAASYPIRAADLEAMESLINGLRVSSMRDGPLTQERFDRLLSILADVRSGYGGPRPEAEDQ
jgi:hypothetical protein